MYLKWGIHYTYEKINLPIPFKYRSLRNIGNIYFTTLSMSLPGFIFMLQIII
jgi:hypothetical protein